MDDREDLFYAPLRQGNLAPPFSPKQVISRYHASLRRQARRRTQLVISGIALTAALLAFLFLNLNGGIGPGFFDPTRVWAGTPIPTLLSTPFVTPSLP